MLSIRPYSQVGIVPDLIDAKRWVDDGPERAALMIRSRCLGESDALWIGAGWLVKLPEFGALVGTQDFDNFRARLSLSVEFGTVDYKG